MDKLMREALEKLLSVEHERGGSLQPDGQFYYRVPESIFRKAEEALSNKHSDVCQHMSATNNVCDSCGAIFKWEGHGTPVRVVPPKQSVSVDGIEIKHGESALFEPKKGGGWKSYKHSEHHLQDGFCVKCGNSKDYINAMALRDCPSKTSCYMETRGIFAECKSCKTTPCECVTQTER